MKLTINSDFLFKEAPWLRWPDIRYGIERGYLTTEGAVRFALDALCATSSQEHYELAMLERDELIFVSPLIESLASVEPKDDKLSKKAWVYVLFLWLYRNMGRYSDPLGMVEQLYADFDYPEEVASFVRYMPPLGGGDLSEERLVQEWAGFLTSLRNELQGCSTSSSPVEGEKSG